MNEHPVFNSAECAPDSPLRDAAATQGAESVPATRGTDAPTAASHSSTPHPLERDVLFRKRKKKGKFSVVLPAPLEGPIADTHAHLGALDAPLALARAAFWGMDFLCCITEPDGDAPRVYAGLDGWFAQARRLLPELLQATETVLAERADDASDEMVSLLAQHRSEGALALPQVRLAVGCHPHTARRWDEELERTMRRALADPRTCAVGEVGLDYFYDLSPRETQRAVFRAQIRLAKEAGVPVFLHIRDAHDEALAILREEGFPEAGTVLHCCSLPPDLLRPWIEEGCYIAYGGIITFAKSEEARAGMRLVPADRLLFETDSPYMAPHPLRGNECYPDFTLFTAAAAAQARGIARGAGYAAFLEQVHGNSLTLQNRPPTAWQRSQAPAAGEGMRP